MNTVYDQIARYIVEAGKTLVEKQEHIVDIGIKKRWLTEEDIRIEQMLETIIKDNDPSHELYAEEEHDSFPEVENVWVADPISGTRSYIDGSPNYSIAVAHMQGGVVQFSAVYHPPTDELFISHRGGGVILEWGENKDSRP